MMKEVFVAWDSEAEWADGKDHSLKELFDEMKKYSMEHGDGGFGGNKFALTAVYEEDGWVLYTDEDEYYYLSAPADAVVMTKCDVLVYDKYGDYVDCVTKYGVSPDYAEWYKENVIKRNWFADKAVVIGYYEEVKDTHYPDTTDEVIDLINNTDLRRVTTVENVATGQTFCGNLYEIHEWVSNMIEFAEYIKPLNGSDVQCWVMIDSVLSDIKVNTKKRIVITSKHNDDAPMLNEVVVDMVGLISSPKYVYVGFDPESGRHVTVFAGTDGHMYGILAE